MFGLGRFGFTWAWVGLGWFGIGLGWFGSGLGLGLRFGFGRFGLG